MSEKMTWELLQKSGESCLESGEKSPKSGGNSDTSGPSYKELERAIWITNFL